MSSKVLIKRPNYIESGRMGGGAFIECMTCVHQINPIKWPDKQRVYSCSKNKISLEIELKDDGYGGGAYICNKFEPALSALKENIPIFETIRPMMEDDVLYHEKGNFYHGIPFEKLPGKFPDDFNK